MFMIDPREIERRAYETIKQIGTFDEKEMEFIRKMISPTITLIGDKS